MLVNQLQVQTCVALPEQKGSDTYKGLGKQTKILLIKININKTLKKIIFI